MILYVLLHLLIGIIVTGVVYRIFKNTTKDEAMTLFFVCVWPMIIFLAILYAIKTAITGLTWLFSGMHKSKEGME